MAFKLDDKLLVRMEVEEKARLYRLSDKLGLKPAQVARIALKEKLDSLEEEIEGRNFARERADKDEARIFRLRAKECGNEEEAQRWLDRADELEKGLKK